MRQVYYSIILIGAALLLLLSSCIKVPIQPEEIVDEPDTAKSTFRAFVIAPGFNTTITVRNRDTLSDGKILRRNEDGTWTMREGDVLRSSVGALDYTSDFSIRLLYTHNLNIVPYTYPSSNRLDSLRKWNMLEIGLRFYTRQKLFSGFSMNIPESSDIKMIAVLAFTNRKGFEQEVISTTRGVTTVSITSLFAMLTDVSYDEIPLSFQPSATIETLSLIIDNYDSVRKRISGRINFKMISGGTTKQTIELRDGVFDNVSVAKRNH